FVLPRMALTDVSAFRHSSLVSYPLGVMAMTLPSASVTRHRYSPARSLNTSTASFAPLASLSFSFWATLSWAGGAVGVVAATRPPMTAATTRLLMSRNTGALRGVGNGWFGRTD